MEEQQFIALQQALTLQTCRSSRVLRAFTLNCWAIGYVPEGLNGSRDVVRRIAAIADFLAQKKGPDSDFDFVFLQVSAPSKILLIFMKM